MVWILQHALNSRTTTLTKTSGCSSFAGINIVVKLFLSNFYLHSIIPHSHLSHRPHLPRIIPGHMSDPSTISVAMNSPVPVFCPIILIRSQTSISSGRIAPERLTLNSSHLPFLRIIPLLVIDCITPPIRPSSGSCHICCPSVKSRYPPICDPMKLFILCPIPNRKPRNQMMRKRRRMPEMIHSIGYLYHLPVFWKSLSAKNQMINMRRTQRMGKWR